VIVAVANTAEASVAVIVQVLLLKSTAVIVLGTVTTAENEPVAFVVTVAVTATVVVPFGAVIVIVTALVPLKPLPVRVTESPGNARVVSPLERLEVTVNTLKALGETPSETMMLCAPLTASGIVMLIAYVPTLFEATEPKSEAAVTESRYTLTTLKGPAEAFAPAPTT